VGFQISLQTCERLTQWYISRQQVPDSAASSENAQSCYITQNWINYDSLFSCKMLYCRKIIGNSIKSVHGSDYDTVLWSIKL